MKIQQKSPGCKVSLPMPKISSLGLLNRMSHLVSIARQETLAPKTISFHNVFTGIKATYFQKTVCSSKGEWTVDKRNACDSFLICQHLQKCPQKTIRCPHKSIPYVDQQHKEWCWLPCHLPWIISHLVICGKGSWFFFLSVLDVSKSQK